MKHILNLQEIYIIYEYIDYLPQFYPATTRTITS